MAEYRMANGLREGIFFGDETFANYLQVQADQIETGNPYVERLLRYLG